MIHKVTTFIEKYHMIEEHSLVAVGVSGGADSLCLLHMLLEYQKRVSFQIVVVHVNHKIRIDAGRDAEFVREICNKHSLPFYLWEEDVETLAAKEKLSVEEAGRKVRYQAFESALKQYQKGENQVTRIAVAHHQGDCAETMLFHLFRGTGVYGMAGIVPVRGKVIRPLLTCSREEIEAYLRGKEIPWCIDSTNEEDTYTRNKIRHHLLPFAEKEICPGATAHVANAGLQLVQLREFLEEEVSKALFHCSGWDDAKKGICLQIAVFKSYPAFLQNQILLNLLDRVSPGRKDITATHVTMLQDLLEKEGRKKLDLPGKIEVIKQYDTLWMGKKNSLQISFSKEEESDFFIQERELQVPGTFILENGDTIECNLVEAKKEQIIEEKKYTKYLDYDKISCCLRLRHRQAGDFLCINDAYNKKSLKEYLIHEKIPVKERQQMLLIADGSHIVWVVGHRISSYYKVKEETKKILQITIRRKRDNGRNSEGDVNGRRS